MHSRMHGRTQILVNLCKFPSHKRGCFYWKSKSEQVVINSNQTSKMQASRFSEGYRQNKQQLKLNYLHMLSMEVKLLPDCAFIIVIEFKKCFIHYFTKCLRDSKASIIFQHATYSHSQCLMLDNVIVASYITRTFLLWNLKVIISL